MNPKDAATADPQRIFERAEAFYQAGHLLWAAHKFGFEQADVGVWATLESFTLELFLKCLSVLEQGWYHGDQHDAGKLFRLLPRQTQKHLEKEWTNALRDSQWWKELPESEGSKLQHAFSIARDSFTKFRYSFEPESRGVEWGLGHLTLAIRTVILKKHPGWGNKLTAYLPPKFPDLNTPAPTGDP